MKGAADSGRRERERVRGGEVQRQEGGARAGWQGGGSRDRDAGEGDSHGMEGKAVLGERHRGGGGGRAWGEVTGWKENLPNFVAEIQVISTRPPEARSENTKCEKNFFLF